MQPATSIFLDLMRFSAACVVFLGHLTSKEVNGVFPSVRWAHEAVVVFFVMSGFVIAYVVSNRERTISSYAAARWGRLYSVILPALVVTLVVDPIGRSASPGLYAAIPNDHTALRILINFLFLQQNWNLTVIPLSNGPFWSLGFEFWYYVIFGASVFLSGQLRVYAVLFFCLCAGPRIVAYMPLWLLGVLAFRVHQARAPSARLCAGLFMFASISFVWLLADNPLASIDKSFGAWFPDRYVDLGLVRIFVGDIPSLPGDLLLGGAFSLMIVSVRGDIPEGKIWNVSVSLIRFLAGSTFTLYAFHAPLTYFFLAWMKVDRLSASGIGLTCGLVFTCCVLFSFLGERQAFWYRSVFLRIFERFGKAEGRHHPMSD